MLSKINNFFNPPTQKIIRQESIQELPLNVELFIEIFSKLDIKNLGKVQLVCKGFEQIASDATLWKKAIIHELAFGSDKWIQYFNENMSNDDLADEFDTFPVDEIITEYRKFQNAFPKQDVKKSLLLVRSPKEFNLSIKGMSEIAKKFFPNKVDGYRKIEFDIVSQYGKQKIENSCWILMTKELPDSRNKNYKKQKKIVKNLTKKGLDGYHITKTAEAITCALAEYLWTKSSSFRFGNTLDTTTYTHCAEKINHLPIRVGGLFEMGLHITHFKLETEEHMVITASKIIKDKPISQ